MAGSLHRNNQLASKSITWAVTYNNRVLEKKEVDLEFIKKHPIALDLISNVFDNVKGKHYDGTSPSRVVGTEITRIGNLDKDELAKQGILAGWQLYMIVGNENQAETGLPSYKDKETGENKLINLDKFDVSKIVELLERLPPGTKVKFVAQMDVNRINDVTLDDSNVTRIGGSEPSPTSNDSIQPFIIPKPIGDGAGLFSGNGGVTDSTTMLIEPTRDSGEGRIVSISDVLLFKGTKEDPVDLGAITQKLTESVKSFDGSPITLSDLQITLFLVPAGKPITPDAHGRITFDSDVRVGLLEIISRQQMNYSQRNALTDSFDYGDDPGKSGGMKVPIAETIRNRANSFSTSDQKMSSGSPQEESALMRLLMNPVERRLWGRLIGLPDEEASNNALPENGSKKERSKVFHLDRFRSDKDKTPMIKAGIITQSQRAFKAIKTKGEGYLESRKENSAGIRSHGRKSKSPFTGIPSGKKNPMAKSLLKEAQPGKGSAPSYLGKKTLAKDRIMDEKAQKKKTGAAFSNKGSKAEPKVDKPSEKRAERKAKRKTGEQDFRKERAKEVNREKDKIKKETGSVARRRPEANKNETISKKKEKKADSLTPSTPWKKAKAMNPYFYNQMIGLTSQRTMARSSSGKRRQSGP